MIGTVLLVTVMAISLYGFSEASAQTTAVTTGTVFSDVNKNAVLNAGEAGLGGISVLCVPHFQSSAPIWVTTDDSGQYRFETQAGCYLTQATVPDWVTGNPDVHAYTAAHEGRTVTINFASWQTNLCEPDYVLIDEQCLGSQSELGPIIGTLAELQQLVEDLLDRITVLEASPGRDIQCPTGQIPVDDICMDIICPVGYELNENHCIQIHCNVGHILDYDTNTCKFAGCPSGYILDGNECVLDTSNEAQPHITTDKQIYTIGDTVHISGKLPTEPMIVKRSLDGDEYPANYYYVYNSQIRSLDGGYYNGFLEGCTSYRNEHASEPLSEYVDLEIVTEIDFEKYYMFVNEYLDDDLMIHYNSTKMVECPIESDGSFSIDFEVTGELFEGEYRAMLTVEHGFGYGEIDGLRTDKSKYLETYFEVRAPIATTG